MPESPLSLSVSGEVGSVYPEAASLSQAPYRPLPLENPNGPMSALTDLPPAYSPTDGAQPDDLTATRRMTPAEHGSVQLAIRASRIADERRRRRQNLVFGAGFLCLAVLGTGLLVMAIGVVLDLAGEQTIRDAEIVGTQEQPAPDGALVHSPIIVEQTPNERGSTISNAPRIQAEPTKPPEPTRAATPTSGHNPSSNSKPDAEAVLPSATSLPVSVQAPVPKADARPAATRPPPATMVEATTPMATPEPTVLEDIPDDEETDQLN